jgi:transcriptional regulator NrdR family protein
MKCGFCGKEHSLLFDTNSTFKPVNEEAKRRYTCMDCIDLEMPYIESFTTDTVVLARHQARVRNFVRNNAKCTCKGFYRHPNCPVHKGK